MLPLYQELRGTVSCTLELFNAWKCSKFTGVPTPNVHSLGLWDSFLETRIRFQKALLAVNRLPQHNTLDKFEGDKNLKETYKQGEWASKQLHVGVTYALMPSVHCNVSSCSRTSLLFDAWILGRLMSSVWYVLAQIADTWLGRLSRYSTWCLAAVFAGY